MNWSVLTYLLDDVAAGIVGTFSKSTLLIDRKSKK
jgi:hypothetical protein